MPSTHTYGAFERFIGKPFDLKKVEFSLLILVQANSAIPPKRLARALAVTAPNLTLLLDRPEAVGQAFNLSGSAPFSYGELIPYLAEQANLSYLDAVIPGPPIRIHHSIAKARALLGYDPQYDVFRSVRDGLASHGTSPS